MQVNAKTSIQYLKGVGEKRAKLYLKLGISTVGDLLYHFPRTYIDLSNPYDILSAPVGENCAVRALLVKKSGEQRIRKGLSLFKLLAVDDNCAELEITMFNTKFTVDSLNVEQEYIFFGRIEGVSLHRKMLSPTVYMADQSCSILPVYPQTAGINSNLMRKNIRQALADSEKIMDMIPPHIRQNNNLGEINECMSAIHFPKNIQAGMHARRRFIFEELLVLCCALAGLRRNEKKFTVDAMQSVDLTPFYSLLPFKPTNAQIAAINDICADFILTQPMNRLIQGDVGSGKTLVAAAAAYVVCQNSKQSAMMVPTEILAEQHYATMHSLLGGLGVRIALLTGSTKASEKKGILNALKNREIDLLIGTHALISEGVEYHNLGLVITDEQHRFGVLQRTRLAQKSEECHVLVMSATPIPRTLSLIIYGDLSVSIIDELPLGRKPVETLVINSAKRTRALGFVKEALDNGHQAYIVCPLVETGEIDTGLRAATEYSQSLAQKELAGYSVGLLHGKMKPKDKEETMRRFKAREIQVMVSTTVIEVGVDVPNSTIIMVENAERFGLSQLHQLRGRVGRGEHKSWCILVSDAKGETARKRLEAMKNISDGFKLAELDLQIRGPGDFFGERQHGLPELKIASLADNMEIMKQAQECALGILTQDPSLKREEHMLLKKSAEEMLFRVGERPN